MVKKRGRLRGLNSPVQNRLRGVAARSGQVLREAPGPTPPGQGQELETTRCVGRTALRFGTALETSMVNPAIM